MKFYRIRAKRPFDIWKHSENDGQGNLTKIVFQYDFYTPDCLFADTSRYFGTRTLCEGIEKAGLTGVDLKPVLTTYSSEYQASVPNEPVKQLLITGKAGNSDFGMQTKTTLIVSDRALEIVKKLGFSNGEIFDYDPDYKVEIPAWLQESDDD